MKSLFSALFLLVSVCSSAQVISIPVQYLPQDFTSYCLLSNAAGETVDDHLFVPQASRLDTIFLEAKGKTGPFHLTILTKYPSAKEELNAFAKATTVINLQPGFVLGSALPMPIPLNYGVIMPSDSAHLIELTLTEQEEYFYNIMLPPGGAIKRHSFSPRKQLGTLKFFESCRRPFYLYVQEHKGGDWQYFFFDGKDSYEQSWRLPEVPKVARNVEVELPFFDDWRIELSAYHLFLDERVFLPILPQGTNVIQGEKLAVMLPSETNLDDYYLNCKALRRHRMYEYAYRGNLAGAQLTRIENTFDHVFTKNNIYLRIGGPDGYFALRSTEIFPVKQEDGSLSYPNDLLEWTIMGEIPKGGIINFNIPRFDTKRVRDLPQLRQFTGARFSKIDFLYPNERITPDRWMAALDRTSTYIRINGGCRITETLVR